jgi:hypothetical protein
MLELVIVGDIGLKGFLKLKLLQLSSALQSAGPHDIFLEWPPRE